MMRLPATLPSHVSLQYRDPQYLMLTETGSGDVSLSLPHSIAWLSSASLGVKLQRGPAPGWKPKGRPIYERRDAHI